MNMYHSIHNINIHSSTVDCRCSVGWDCDCGDCRHILSVCLFRCCQFSRIFCHQRRHALKLIAYDVGAEWGRADGEGNADSGRRRNETDSISGRRSERDIFRSFHLFCIHTHVYPHSRHTHTHTCMHTFMNTQCTLVCVFCSLLFAACFGACCSVPCSHMGAKMSGTAQSNCVSYVCVWVCVWAFKWVSLCLLAVSLFLSL